MPVALREDDEPSGRMMGLWLDAAGHSCTVFQSGTEFFKALRRETSGARSGGQCHGPKPGFPVHFPLLSGGLLRYHRHNDPARLEQLGEYRPRA